jgi:Tfp pilus assembly protein PilF
MRNSRTTYIIIGAVLGIALIAFVVVARQMGGGEGEGAGGPDDVLEAARSSLDAGEYATARTDLEAAVEEDPGNSEAHFLLGQVYNRQGELLKAADEFRTVIALDPENGAAHHNLGVTYFQLQDPNAAVAEFEIALKIDPDDPDTHYQLGATYLVLALSGAAPPATPDPELLAQAVDQFNAALDLEEDMPEALIGLGNVHLQQGDYAQAIQALQRAIEKLPNSPEAHYALGEAYAQTGDVTNACETFGRFLELNPPATWQAQAEQVMTALQCP